MMVDEDYETWGFFAIESQSDVFTRDQSVLHTQMDFFDTYILPLFNVYRYVNNCASRKMQIYAAQPRIMISSKRKSIQMRFLLTPCNCLHFCLSLENFTFPLSFLRNWRDIVLFHRNLSDFVHCLNICHIYYLAWDFSAVFYCTTGKCGLCTLSLLVIEMKILSCNLEYSCTLLKYP